MKKEIILNSLLIIFAIIVFGGIALKIKIDIDKVQQHLTECKEVCYPYRVIERFSRRGCYCDSLEEPKETVDSP